MRHCSRACYLISPENWIVEKFEIFDWEQVLSERLK